MGDPGSDDERSGQGEVAQPIEGEQQPAQAQVDGAGDQGQGEDAGDQRTRSRAQTDRPRLGPASR
jgi:hypothetical protein